MISIDKWPTAAKKLPYIIMTLCSLYAAVIKTLQLAQTARP